MSDSQQHFFTADPEVASDRQTVEMVLSDLTVRLETDSGVFSGGRLDRGTRILLERTPKPPVLGDLLDLGCGYGPIAVALALRSKSAQIWAVDVNNRALELTRDNASQLHLDNIATVRPEDVPDEVRFSAIYSNPPIHIGKAQLHKLLTSWLSRLTVGGFAYLVVQKNLGSDSLAKWLQSQDYPTHRLTSQSGYRILRVGASAGKAEAH